MSCPCGSTKCVCDEECYCLRVNCQCSKCTLLSKICPRCRLPIYVAASKENYACQTCSCDEQAQGFHSEAQSSFQTESETSYESSIETITRDTCLRCNLPTFHIATDETHERTVRRCGCPLVKRISTSPGIHSEHETSNSTSDHREISADRQVRKGLSRKTRTEKSNWQAKKVKDHSSNSPEDYSNTETGDSEAFFADISNTTSVVGQDENFNVTYINPGIKNLNPNLNEPQRGFSPRLDNTSAGNASLLANTSAVSSQRTPEVSSPFPRFGVLPLNQNVHKTLPYPFPRFTNPNPGLPVSSGQQSGSPNLNPTRRTPRPFLPQQTTVARTEKMDKWFESLHNVLKTSGELPDAETAATLDKMDKAHLEEEQYSSNSEGLPHCEPVTADTDNGNDTEDIEPTTDTDMSTSLSKSHKESESD